ncbi:hypothetical protein pb186bvf_006369 [Paramecium bursaria]
MQRTNTLMMGGKNGQKQVQNTKKVQGVLKIDKEKNQMQNLSFLISNSMPTKSKQDIEEYIKQTIKETIEDFKKTSYQLASNQHSDSDSEISYNQDADKGKSQDKRNNDILHLLAFKNTLYHYIIIIHHTKEEFNNLIIMNQCIFIPTFHKPEE